VTKSNPFLLLFSSLLLPPFILDLNLDTAVIATPDETSKAANSAITAAIFLVF
jgi:hypothetical protein